MQVATRTGMEFGFAIAHAVDGAGKRYPVARFICNSENCTQVLDRTIKSGEMVPEMIAKWARRRGWLVVSGRPGHVTCPDCARDKALEDISTGREDTLMPTKEPTKPVETGNGTAPPIPMPGTPGVNPPEPEPEIRVLTYVPNTEQRIAIRHLLEKNFDEELGYYVHGYSDQRIAEELDIPRILVERAREYAYGPIKVTQAQLDARQKLDTLTSKLENLESSARELAAQISRDVLDLRQEIDMLRRDAAA